MMLIQSMSQYCKRAFHLQPHRNSEQHWYERQRTDEKNYDCGMQTLSERLKEAREELGLTQEQLRLKAGLKSQSIIGGLESGHRHSSRHIPAIAEALGVNALWLAQGKGPKKGRTAEPAERPVEPEEQVDADVFFRCWSAVASWIKQAPGERKLTEEQRIHMAANLYDVFHAQHDVSEIQMLMFIKGWERFRGTTTSGAK